MVEERTRKDSGRELLEELEDGWGTPHAEVGSEAAISEAAKVDEGWLDDLFPGGEEDDDEDEDDEDEPELPDERLDPVAFAAAKKARDERALRKKERRKARADAKRTRQRARADAMKARQKQKSKKSRASTPSPRSVRAAVKAERASTLAEPRAADGPAERTEPLSKIPRTIATTPAARPSTLGSIKLLAVVLAVLLAVAAVAAALMK